MHTCPAAGLAIFTFHGVCLECASRLTTGQIDRPQWILWDEFLARNSTHCACSSSRVLTVLAAWTFMYLCTKWVYLDSFSTFLSLFAGIGCIPAWYKHRHTIVASMLSVCTVTASICGQRHTLFVYSAFVCICVCVCALHLRLWESVSMPHEASRQIFFGFEHALYLWRC